MTKLAGIVTLSMTKTAENHTLWGRTYLYNPYKGVLSPGPQHIDHRDEPAPSNFGYITSLPEPQFLLINEGSGNGTVIFQLLNIWCLNASSCKKKQSCIYCWKYQTSHHLASRAP